MFIAAVCLLITINDFLMQFIVTEVNFNVGLFVVQLVAWSAAWCLGASASLMTILFDDNTRCNTTTMIWQC